LFVLCSDSQTLKQIEDVAKAGGKGKWSSEDELAGHIHNVKWLDDYQDFLNSHRKVAGMLNNLLQLLCVCITSCLLNVSQLWTFLVRLCMFVQHSLCASVYQSAYQLMKHVVSVSSFNL